MPKEELKGRMRVPPKFFDTAIRRLLSDGLLAEAGPVVHLPGHRVQLDANQQSKIDSFIQQLTKSPYAPPSDLSIEPDLLNILIGQRRVVRVSDDVVFDASAYDKMVESILDRIKAQDKITVAEVRDMFHTSRKYALALMEYLDEQKITRRVGDERVLR